MFEISTSMPTKFLLLRELLVSFFVGSLPMYIWFFFNDEDAMLRRLGFLKPTDEIIVYYFVLLGIYSVVYLVRRFWRLASDEKYSFTGLIYNVCGQIGLVILSVYRGLTGSIPMAMLVLLCLHGFRGALNAFLLSLIAFFVFLFTCFYLAKFSIYIEELNSYNSN